MNGKNTNTQEHRENPSNIDRQKVFSVIHPVLTFSEKIAASGKLRMVVLVLLPVLVLLMYPVDRFDYDLWWHMALGKYYVTHHTLMIDQSIFSWTPVNAGWIYNTCLGSLLIYLIYSQGGGLGLWLFQWFVFVGIFGALYAFIRVCRQRLDITGITLIAAVFIAFSLSCSYYKPELISPLMLAWLGFVYVYVKVTGRKFLFYIYPFVFALWVNLHGGFIIGFCLLGSISLGELLNRIFFPQKSFEYRDIFHLWLACFLSFLATFVNPYGVNYLLSIYHGVMSETFNMSNTYIQAYTSLWSFFSGNMNTGVSFFRMGQVALIMTGMMFFLLVLFIYDFMKNKSFDFSFLILTCATYVGSMQAVRAIYMFPLVFFSAFYYLLYQLKLKDVSAKAAIVALPVFILFFVHTGYFTFRYGTDNKWFGAGIEDYAPVKEVDFLKKYRLRGPLFNDYLVGGYLMWAAYPDYKVFIDPRLVPYYKQVAPDYWTLVSRKAAKEDIDHFTQKYPFKTAIIHYRELPLIFDFLNAGWRLLFFGNNAAILIHPSELPRLPAEIALVDLGPMRFRDVKDPQVLLSVFSLYVNLKPEASPVIYDLYRKNVSDCYRPKREHLRVMAEDMKQRNLMRIPD